MMKLLLSLTLIWALYSTGEALVCETCTDATCSTTAPVPCPTMCITASIQAVSFGTPGQQITKACAPPSLCPATGSHTFSVNLGVSSALASATCCSTDRCNSNTLPFPVVPAGNSLQCHVCNPITSDCSSSVQCRGTEDRCFQASVTNSGGTSPAFGCASTNMCAAAASLGSLPFMQGVGTITSGPACCGTSLCNTLTTKTTTDTPTTTITTPTTTTTTPTTTSTLVCETCTDATCSTTAAVTCPTGTMCITASIQAVSFGTPGQQIFKACAPPSLCPATGSQTFSVNLGVSSALVSATCCNTDNCNSNTLPFPVVPADNSLLCYFCDPITSDCSLPLQCKGTEDRCFQARVTNGTSTSPAFGCASSNLCAAATILETLPFMQGVGTITSGTACCGTSLCNAMCQRVVGFYKLNK